MPIPFPQAALYAVTGRECSLGRSTLHVVQELLAAGVRIIQYREKALPQQEMLEECLAIRAATRAAGCCFIVNDHVALALACEADGIHVGQDDLPLWAVQKAVDGRCFIGVSVRTMHEAQEAIAQGADYLGAGAVYPTGTKTDAVHTGIGFLQELVPVSPVSVVAIGGINEQTIAEVARTGVRCFAIVSALVGAPDISARAATLRGILQQEGIYE